jgi:hypothetical protein
VQQNEESRRVLRAVSRGGAGARWAQEAADDRSVEHTEAGAHGRLPDCSGLE